MKKAKTLIIGLSRTVYLTICLAVAGCGYHPLYGDRADAVTSTDLAQVYVGPISDRTGQQLRNFLLERLSTKGDQTRPIYTLNVALSIASTGVSLSRDNTTSRTSITATAKYALTETASGRTLYTSTSRATDAYDVLVSDFGTLVSRDDAVNRALREVSDDIRTQLAIYFQDKRDNGATSRRVKATGAN